MIQSRRCALPAQAYPARDDCHFRAGTRAIDNERRRRSKQRRHFGRARHDPDLTAPERRKSVLTRYVYSTTRAFDVLSHKLSTLPDVDPRGRAVSRNVLSIRRMLTQEVEDDGSVRRARYDEPFSSCAWHHRRESSDPASEINVSDFVVTAEFHTASVEGRRSLSAVSALTAFHRKLARHPHALD